MVPVCDKRYHIYNRFRIFWAEIQKLWNYPLLSSTMESHFFFYNQHSDSFAGEQARRLRYVTVKNVLKHLSITDTNLNGLMDRLVCKAGTSS